MDNSNIFFCIMFIICLPCIIPLFLSQFIFFYGKECNEGNMTKDCSNRSLASSISSIASYIFQFYCVLMIVGSYFLKKDSKINSTTSDTSDSSDSSKNLNT